MKVNMRIVAIAIAFGTLSAAPAMAGKIKNNCKDEIAKFCTSAGPGLLACLEAKKAELSDACKKAVEAKAAATTKK